MLLKLVYCFWIRLNLKKKKGSFFYFSNSSSDGNIYYIYKKKNPTHNVQQLLSMWQQCFIWSKRSVQPLNVCIFNILYIWYFVDLLHESKTITDLFKETSIQIFQCIVTVLVLRNRLRHYLHQPNRRPDLQQNPQPNRRTDPQQNPQQPLRRSARRRSTPKKLNL